MHLRVGVLFWLTIGGALGCASDPSGTRMLGAMTSVDASVRRAAFESGHGGRIDGDRRAKLEAIVAQFTGSDWQGPTIRVAVLASDNPNAYVLASGHLYATLGLFDEVCTDDELAAVVAHELAHLHDLRSFFDFNLTPEQRLEIEAQADTLALGMLRAAGYRVTALPEMVNRLANEQPDGWARHRCDRISALIDEAEHVAFADGASAAEAFTP